MKQLTIILLFAILLLLNCFGPNEEDRITRNNQKSWLLYLMSFPKTSDQANVVDNKDGTFTYTYQIIEKFNILGIFIKSHRTSLIRRCLIGQVYRPTENDCQGTGSKDTLWGASKLQWCPTNDTSCEINGKADPAISPAAKACADDNFGGKNWNLLSKDDGIWAISKWPNANANHYIYQDWENGSIYYSYISIWVAEASSSDSVFYTFDLSRRTKKDSFLNVLCVAYVVLE